MPVCDVLPPVYTMLVRYRFGYEKTIVMTAHNNFILRLRIGYGKDVKTHGKQRKTNHGHTNQMLLLIEGKSEKNAST